MKLSPRPQDPSLVSFHITIVLVIVVLAIVMPLFCLLGSVASYRRVRHRRAMLSPSQRLCQVIVVLRADTGLLSAVFQPLRTLSSIRVIFEFVSHFARGEDSLWNLWLKIEEVRAR